MNFSKIFTVCFGIYFAIHYQAIIFGSIFVQVRIQLTRVIVLMSHKEHGVVQLTSMLSWLIIRKANFSTVK